MARKFSFARGRHVALVTAGVLAAAAFALTGCPGPEPHTLDASPGQGGATSVASSGTGSPSGMSASIGPSGHSASISSTGQGGMAASVTSAGGQGGMAASVTSAGGQGGMAASVTSAGGQGGMAASTGSIGTGGGGGAGGAGGGAGGGCSFCGTACVDITTDPQNCGACGRFCSSNGTVALSCEGGVCTSTCAPNRFNLSLPSAPQDDDGCESQGKRVFVSSTSITADFGGAAKADALCQTWADAQTLGGTWMAWISDSQSSPSTRFVQSLTPYTRIDGVVIAKDWTALTSGTLSQGIDMDETGKTPITQEVWTGTDTDGVADGSGYCVDWTSTTHDTGDTPVVGISGATDLTWTSVYPQFCDRQVLLYCFEQ